MGGIYSLLHPDKAFERLFIFFSNHVSPLQIIENQVRDRSRELDELQEAITKHGGDQPELEAEQQALQTHFQQLLTPLAERKGKFEAAKAVHQFYRDLADELVSISDNN